MDAEKTKTIVTALNDKAVDAKSAAEALHFSQAALNAANSFAAIAAATKNQID